MAVKQKTENLGQKEKSDTNEKYVLKNKLYRSKEDKIIAGVCGGISEYLDIDPIIIRLIFLFFTLL